MKFKRRDFNAECPDRPGVTIGEDLADRNITLAAKNHMLATALEQALSLELDVIGLARAVVAAEDFAGPLPNTTVSRAIDTYLRELRRRYLS